MPTVLGSIGDLGSLDEKAIFLRAHVGGDFRDTPDDIAAAIMQHGNAAGEVIALYKIDGAFKFGCPCFDSRPKQFAVSALDRIIRCEVGKFVDIAKNGFYRRLVFSKKLGLACQKIPAGRALGAAQIKQDNCKLLFDFDGVHDEGTVFA